jgi:predicted transposase YdaD
MGSMNSEDFTVFATWVKNILVKGLPEESAKQVEEIMAREEEAENMIYGIEVALKKERRKERREGKIEGKIEGRIEDILEWLDQIGNVPEELEQHIKAQKDVDTLRTWLKWAARAESVEEFIDKVGMN